MGIRPLPVVAELCDRSGLALGDEDRVVAETAGSVRLGHDLPLEHADRIDFTAVGGDRDQVRDHPRVPVGLARESLQECQVLPALVRPACGMDAGLAAQGIHLDP
jgi:hypothetical protein